MSDVEHARLMLRLGQDDLAAMQVLGPSPRVSSAIFGFHAQQAVEKAAKAWLSLLGVEYPPIHLLNELFGLVEEQGVESLGRFRHLEELTPFAVQFRYEEFTGLGQELDRKKVIREVGEFLAHVERLIPRAKSNEGVAPG
jgi:HEPN domain-containing protein